MSLVRRQRFPSPQAGIAIRPSKYGRPLLLDQPALQLEADSRSSSRRERKMRPVLLAAAFFVLVALALAQDCPQFSYSGSTQPSEWGRFVCLVPLFSVLPLPLSPVLHYSILSAVFVSLFLASLFRLGSAPPSFLSTVLRNQQS